MSNKETVEQHIQEREESEKILADHIQRLKAKGIEVENATITKVILMDPNDHQLEWVGPMQPDFTKSLMAFTISGFEDIYTGFIGYGKQSKDGLHMVFAYTVNQFGMAQSLDSGAARKVDEEIYNSEIAVRALGEEICMASMKEWISDTSYLLPKIGRKAYIESVNHLLIESGKPPMVVL